MHIPQDVVDLIIDQIPLLADYEWRLHLQRASLVSTAWVNRSQHHLFSTLELNRSWKIKEWCSKIEPDPSGVSRHVRVLVIGSPYYPTTSRLTLADIKNALPHLISFKNLQELALGTVCTSLHVLAPVFSSSPGILKLRRWTRQNAGIQETWNDINNVVDFLPSLTHVSLSGYGSDSSEIHIQLSANEGSSLAVKCFKFHELEIDLGVPHSPSFLKTCGPHLQVLDLRKYGVRNASEGQPSPAD